jgi:hypothetical protein
VERKKKGSHTFFKNIAENVTSHNFFTNYCDGVKNGTHASEKLS